MGDYFVGIWSAIKSIPKSVIELFFVSDELSNRSIVMELFQKNVKFGRKFYLAYQKSMFFTRAAGQLLVFYLLSSFFLSKIPIDNEPLLALCASVIIAVNSVYSKFLIFNFHPKAFKEILFENDYQTEKKEYRMLGLTVKLLCIFQICAIIIKGFNLILEIPLQKLSLVGVEWFLLFVFALLILFYNTRSLFNRHYGICVLRKDIPNKIEIVMINETLLVDPNHQFIVENSSGNLYIAPMHERVNPNFASYPKPCQIPISDISYIQLGAKRIEYDYKKKNWKYTK